MAYYTGISGLQSFGGGGAGDPNIPQTPAAPNYTQLGQTNYTIPQPLPVQQSSGAQAAASAINPLAGGTPITQNANSTQNLQYAKGVDDVPDVVQQASQRYLGGTSGYGDPSQSLFGRNLTSQYNQWTNQYGTPGQQFVPWALQTGSSGGNYDPSQVDLYSSIAGKDPKYNFKTSTGQLMQSQQYLNPMSGQSVGSDPATLYGGLSTNYKDISQDYIKNMLNQYKSLGAENIPDPVKYASQYYASLAPQMPSTDSSGYFHDLMSPVTQNYLNYTNYGLNSGLIKPQAARNTYSTYVPPTTGHNNRTTMIG